MLANTRLMFSWIVFLYGIFEFGTCRKSDTFKEISVFDDSFLPNNQAKDLSYPVIGSVPQIDPFFKPNNVHKAVTKFKICTRRGGCTEQISVGIEGANPHPVDLRAIERSGFDPSHKTIVLIPGLYSGNMNSWVHEMQKNWLQIEDSNVIEMSWNSVNTDFIFNRAVASTSIASREVTIFIFYLAQLFLDDPKFGGSEMAQLLNSIHLIGHSLGAHISGYIGKDFGGKIGRITALDPSGPIHNLLPREKRLDKTDAKLVEAIHTSIYPNPFDGLILNPKVQALVEASNLPFVKKFYDTLKRDKEEGGSTVWYGTDKQVAHIHYYANRGSSQPGCDDISHVCEHVRAHQIINDLLNYEIAIRAESEMYEFIGRSRQLAFPASSYGEFISGRIFSRQACQFLLTDRLNSRETFADLNQSVRDCYIPFDLFKPLDAYREELSREFNIDLESKDYPIIKRKFYFTTLASRPLMGQQYLLRVKLDSRRSYWNSSKCLLNASIRMPDGSLVSTSLDRDVENELVRVENEFVGFAMTFTNRMSAITPTKHHRLPKTEPIYVELRITDRPMASIRNPITMWSRTHQAEGINNHSSRCIMLIDSIEIRPLNSKFSESISITSFKRKDPGIEALTEDNYKIYRFDKHRFISITG